MLTCRKVYYFRSPIQLRPAHSGAIINGPALLADGTCRLDGRGLSQLPEYNGE